MSDSPTRDSPSSATLGPLFETAQPPAPAKATEERTGIYVWHTGYDAGWRCEVEGANMHSLCAIAFAACRLIPSTTPVTADLVTLYVIRICNLISRTQRAQPCIFVSPLCTVLPIAHLNGITVLVAGHNKVSSRQTYSVHHKQQEIASPPDHAITRLSADGLLYQALSRKPPS